MNQEKIEIKPTTVCPKCSGELTYVDSIRYYNAIEDDISYDDIYRCKTCKHQEIR